ncbi:MAG: hypothetical protein WCE64_02905 [Bacteroidales bacterium]
MERSEFKNLLTSALDPDSNAAGVSAEIQEAGVNYSFSEGFRDKILDKIFAEGKVVRQVEFVRNLNYVFNRIALTGVAAIIIMLISIFLMSGSFSLNSFLGLENSFDESIICFLTGN